MYTIVEVETTDALPGAHQLIKYRALLCAQKGLQLNASKVKGVLVAWAIPRDVKRFCKKYGLEAWEHRPIE
jgi:RecB family endonuclease NucS